LIKTPEAYLLRELICYQRALGILLGSLEAVEKVSEFRFLAKEDVYKYLD